jgi:hypothetical protein
MTSPLDDGDPNIDRIACALSPSDALVIAGSDGLRTPGFPSLYLIVDCATHDVVLNLAGVTALRDRCDAFIREHTPLPAERTAAEGRAWLAALSAATLTWHADPDPDRALIVEHKGKALFVGETEDGLLRFAARKTAADLDRDGVRVLVDFASRWLRTQEVQHTSNDLTDRDGAESIAAAVARHVVSEGE